MKAYLLHRDRDFDWDRREPPNAAALVQDLELPTLLAAMSDNDPSLLGIIRKVMLASTVDQDTIRHRQAVIADCIGNGEVVWSIFKLAGETIEAERKHYSVYGFRSPSLVLHRSVEVMQMLVGSLRKLRDVARDHSNGFASEGFTTLFATLRRELPDGYFTEVERHLKKLKFRGGVLMSARLGDGNKGIDYILRKENPSPGTWIENLFVRRPKGYAFTLAPRDDNGARALSELNDRGVDLAADALARSTDHIVSFFKMLRTELAFYVGCLNLHGKLSALGEPVCFPDPVAPGARRLAAEQLYDPCLALNLGRQVVANDVAADGKDLLIITGANQGGKSTFLRSFGVAQLMMQCGLFVAAESFAADTCERLLTHYRREEDAAMNSGKFDEELSRMSGVVDALVPNSLVLFNESFASTNEREGSEVARQIVTALIERHMKVVFVTHQYEFAHGFLQRRLPAALFLRAEREDGGTRSFKVVAGDPMPTSHGRDLYDRIFGPDDPAAANRGTQVEAA